MKNKILIIVILLSTFIWGTSQSDGFNVISSVDDTNFEYIADFDSILLVSDLYRNHVSNPQEYTKITVLNKELEFIKSFNFGYEGYIGTRIYKINYRKESDDFYIVSDAQSINSQDYYVFTSILNINNYSIDIIDTLNLGDNRYRALRIIDEGNNKLSCFGTLYNQETFSLVNHSMYKIDQFGYFDHNVKYTANKSTSSFPMSAAIKSKFSDKYYAWHYLELYIFDNLLNFEKNVTGFFIGPTDTIPGEIDSLGYMLECNIEEIRLNEFYCGCKYRKHKVNGFRHGVINFKLSEKDKLEQSNFLELNINDENQNNFPAVVKNMDSSSIGNHYFCGTENVKLQNPILKGEPNQIYLYKLDKDNNTIWDFKFGNDGHYFLYGVKTTNDDGCLLYGQVYNYYGEQSINGFILKIDKNGNLVNSVDIPQENIKITLYPNPTIDQFSLDITSLETKNVSLSIYNTSGQLMDHFSEIPKDNLYNIEQYPNGTYHIVINKNNQLIAVKKLIKI